MLLRSDSYRTAVKSGISPNNDLLIAENSYCPGKYLKVRPWPDFFCTFYPMKVRGFHPVLCDTMGMTIEKEIQSHDSPT